MLGSPAGGESTQVDGAVLAEESVAFSQMTRLQSSRPISLTFTLWTQGMYPFNCGARVAHGGGA